MAEANTASLSSSFEQYTLLGRLADAEAQSKPLDDAMVVNEPAKLVAGSSKHPDDVDVVDGECKDFYTLLISHKSPRELEPDILSMLFSK